MPIAPALPNPSHLTPAPSYTPDIDPGIAVYDATGKLSLIQWTTFNFGAQYYLPRLDDGMFVSANYAHTSSANARSYATAAERVRDHEEWYDFNVFGDPYPGVRFGLEYAHFGDYYVDSNKPTQASQLAVNHRVQLSGYFIFLTPIKASGLFIDSRADARACTAASTTASPVRCHGVAGRARPREARSPTMHRPQIP